MSFCAKFVQIFLVENWKSEHHHWILHIRISLGIKFHIELTILIFVPNLPKKGISSLVSCASLVVTYYIKLFRAEADRRYFNVSSPSSRRDKKHLSLFLKAFHWSRSNFFGRSESPTSNGKVIPVADLGHCQSSIFFAKIFNSEKSLIIFAKSSIIDFDRVLNTKP